MSQKKLNSVTNAFIFKNIYALKNYENVGGLDI